MIYDFKRYETIRRSLGITSNQLYFCILLLEQDYNKKLELFSYYCTVHGGFDYMDIKALEEKGYLENFSPKPIKTIEKSEIIGNKLSDYKLVDEDYILEMFMVTPLFKGKIYIDADIAAEELLKVAPSWIYINGKRTSIKTVSDREEFYQYYNTIINGDILKHKLIVEMFTHYKRLVEADKISGMGIRKALESRLWEQIQEIIEEEKDNSYTKKSK